VRILFNALQKGKRLAEAMKRPFTIEVLKEARGEEA
jgi:hypothetical protein